MSAPRAGPSRALGTRTEGPVHGAHDNTLEPPTIASVEPQSHPCAADEYKGEDIHQCASCARAWPSDSCRFQDIRFICRGADGKITGFYFQQYEPYEPYEPYGSSMSWRKEWNIPLLHSHIHKTRKAIATYLLPSLRKELQHVSLPVVVSRPRETEVRATCDACLTSIFSCSWICRSCGQEGCADCVRPEKELGASSVTSEHDFVPMTRFSKDELVDAIQAMEELLSIESTGFSPPSYPHTPPPHTLPSTEFQAQSSTEVPSHQIPRFTQSELTDAIFRALWANGDPLLVTDVGDRLKMSWTPEFFIKNHGTESCLVVECQTHQEKQMTVGDFFRTFGRYRRRKLCWKLKDWPPSSDFEAVFPDLYYDFNQAVPMPNYVRRDGTLNLASHFPFNVVAPDLGPKMYNANANLVSPNNKGSTRLHMDIADAVNIMTYAAPAPDGSEGRAAWDLFRAHDSDKLRLFLRRKFSLEGLDPIHSQQVYLDDDARQELLRDYGVKSYRVYQTAGQAIFIPAGCAHQVRNLSDCIKVAIDFVSPENIERCEQLTREFREENLTEAWKEDVLQLHTMMWFAWLSCCRQSKARTIT
ncbi:Clavaminate synthase-like protein [Mycena galericulata]|nr:Clavaminate synthase-like protein [Mycena galericulata]